MAARRKAAAWCARDSARAHGLPDDRFAFGIRDTSRYTGAKESSIREAIRTGRLKALLPGDSMRGALIRPEAVDEWFASSEAEAAKVLAGTTSAA